MADFDDFENADSAPHESDPVADFLKREQDELAELDDNFDGFKNPPMGDFTGNEFGDSHIYGNTGPSGGDGFDPFTGGSALEGSHEYGQTEDHSSDPYNAIKHADKARIEPEKIRRWREEQAEMLLKKDAESEKKKAEWREVARRELEDWYRHRDEQVDKAKKINREAEDAFVQERDEKKPGGEWERICRLCDFNPKNARNAKDISRMRSILLQLKQTPVERQ